MSGTACELRDGVGPTQLIDDLERKRAEGSNALTGTSLERIRDAYLRWADETQRLLQFSFADALLPLGLVSQRHWQIHELTGDSTQAYPVIEAEVEFQRRQLELLADSLRQTLKAVGTAQGLIAVLDTNVLLHHEAIADLPWTVILGAPAIRLLLPLRVIQELDEKKWSESDKLRKRARGIIPDLARLLAEPRLSPEVTIEAPVLPGLSRSLDADQDILDTCLVIQRFADNDLCLVTGDLGMTLRAQVAGLTVKAMPAGYRRVADNEPATAAATK